MTRPQNQEFQMFKFNLMQKVKHTIHGVKGTVISQVSSIDDGIFYMIQPMSQDGINVPPSFAAAEKFLIPDVNEEDYSEI